MKKTFADIAAARKRYDPDVEGFGHVREWRGSFYQRMGWEEAQRVIEQQKRTPRQILGVSLSAPWNEIRTAFRKLSMACHPDRIKITGLSYETATEQFKELSAAYAVLAHEFGE